LESSKEILEKLRQALENRRIMLSERSETSSLWISYQKMVRIARLLLAADRSGDWSLHLEALVESLPIFAAAGHSNYLKSAYHYVQQMLALEEREPTVHNIFFTGSACCAAN
jgi:hypothetical protein